MDYFTITILTQFGTEYVAQDTNFGNSTPGLAQTLSADYITMGVDDFNDEYIPQSTTFGNATSGLDQTLLVDYFMIGIIPDFYQDQYIDQDTEFADEYKTNPNPAD